ncbi:hypothetical protein HanIR_Chr08g0367341 [Helianthus annuus]|nr:hypothetical protein HanIR_Chr08g0367341 [Helianthus annuus]
MLGKYHNTLLHVLLCKYTCICVFGAICDFTAYFINKVILTGINTLIIIKTTYFLTNNTCISE